MTPQRAIVGETAGRRMIDETRVLLDIRDGVAQCHAE